MLIYLFFIFTCGWCVCWLIFLNYQQQARLVVEGGQAEGRQSQSQRLDRRPQTAEVVSPGQLELVVEEGGRHRALRRESLRGLPDSELELAEWDLFESQEDLSLFAAPARPPSPPCPACPRPAPPQMRGWPEHLIEPSGPASGEPAAWPLVALRENPLNGLAGPEPAPGPGGQRRLARSRLLSLQPGQRERRAALRWVSGHSVQLLVQAPADEQHGGGGGGGLLMLKEPHRQPEAAELERRPMSAGDNNEQHRWRAEPQRQQRDLLQLMRQRLAAAALAQQHTGELPTLQQLQQRRRLQQAAGQRQQSRSNAGQSEMEQQLSGAGEDAAGPILSSPSPRPIHLAQRPRDNFAAPNSHHIGQTAPGDERLASATPLSAAIGATTTTTRMADQQPVPRPRVATSTSTTSTTSTSTANTSNTTTTIQAELSVLTSPQHPRVREISNGNHEQQSPASSVLSDSTTLITEAAMNSAELIPKLIERLDRKLVVMKDEQLSLMREIELNEATGRRLFAQMQTHLTASEFDKIALHANEIEKVTKLILSLKLRLKRVECELKERSTNNTVGAPTTTSQLQQEETRATPLMKTAPPLQTTTRGVSDPTSTIGLPKRNHQHHASLQLPHQQPSAKLMGRQSLTTTSGSLTSSANSSPISSPRGPAGSVLTNQQQQLHLHREEEEQQQSPSPSQEARDVSNQAEAPQAKTASTSSDSIFNCADSAIGSTITGHGGSATNIMAAEPARAETLKQSSSPSGSTHSSLVSTSSSARRQQQLASPGSQHLSSTMSVSSSQSSMSSSSVPSSPPLASPNNQQPQKTTADSNNNGGRCGQVTSLDEAQDSMVHLLSDIDILIAKRNKLISQLEEAHQLEECIVHRNNIIIQRILKKYFKESNDDDSSGHEIEDFRQFTRLKSLLLKDTHDIADRIDNAELQLTELKQTNAQ